MGLIYEHWRLDTNECFYVGKSMARNPYARASDLSARNVYHGSVVNKLKDQGLVEVRTAEFKGIKKAALNNLERLCIAHWRMYIGDRLTNATPGGDGGAEGDENPMRDPEIAAKISGENHYIHKDSSKMSALLDRMVGDRNPAKAPGIGAKISAKKKGVPKPYFVGDNNPARQPGVGEKISRTWASKPQEEKDEIVARANATKANKTAEEKALTAARRSASIKTALANKTPEEKAEQRRKSAETRRRNKELKLAAEAAATEKDS
jgi:hypothetical protein